MAHVVFLHPDLGIGGAERAVIDAALALKSKGHTVEFVTSHHDVNHCFKETKDGTLKVTAVGDWLPRSLFGRCNALFAYLRMIYAAIYLVFFSGINFDVIFLDQVSACTPVLLLTRAKVIFYCHFPDMLLTKRESFFKKLYRGPIDSLEEWTTGMAHVILVNSQFTAGIFKDTFKSLGHIEPEVVYPIPNFDSLDKSIDDATDDLIPSGLTTVFLSINRYERKKNLPLAIHALDKLRAKNGGLEGIHLIMAGGYDERVVENKEHYQELVQLVKDLNLNEHVTFHRSFSDSQKRTLLSLCTALLYTPDKEHFGMVPIEAMYLKCPVIAVQSGGPLETVKDGVTGFLCSQTSEAFSLAMLKFLKEKNLQIKLGEAGHIRVVTKFSYETFTNQLDVIVRQQTCIVGSK